MKRTIALWLAALMLAAQPIQAAVCVGFGQSSGGLSVSDNFTYSDGDLTGSWTNSPTRQSMVVATNQIRGNGDDWYSEYWNADSFDADQEVCLTVPTIDNRIGVGVRMSSSDWSGYGLTVTSTGAQLFRYNNSSRTDLATYSAISAGQTLCLSVSGTGSTVTLQATLNGSAQTAYSDTDGNRITSGQPGLFAYGNVSRGDNWTAEEL